MIIIILSLIIPHAGVTTKKNESPVTNQKPVITFGQFKATKESFKKNTKVTPSQILDAMNLNLNREERKKVIKQFHYVVSN